MNEIRLRVTRENSTVDGFQVGLFTEWQDMEFDDAEVFQEDWRSERLQVPNHLTEESHRVRFRWPDSKVRIGRTGLGRVASVRVERESDGNAWCWVVGLGTSTTMERT